MNSYHNVEKFTEILFRDGYIHLKNILIPQELQKLNQEADRLIKPDNQNTEKTTSQNNNKNLGAHNQETYNMLQVIEHSDMFDYLTDDHRTFPLIKNIMGDFLQVSGVDLFVRKPVIGLSNLNKFHTDGGPSLQKYAPDPKSPPLLIKAQFFLTDVTQDYAGNFVVVPQSHLSRINYFDKNCLIHECNKYLESGTMPPNAKQIHCQAGDVLIHLWTLWHAVSENRSENTRKSISIRYSQLWERPYYKAISQNVLDRLSARQKRLFGYLNDNPDPNEFYSPHQQHEIMEA